jgi:DNA-directed RNA polymerase subunit M/transcription elongation factor TFIIS
MDEITLKTQFGATCCAGEKINKNVSLVYTGDSGIIGPGFVSYHKIEDKYFCPNCGQVYLPTEKNKLNDFKTSHIESVLKNTSGVTYDKSKTEEIVKGLTEGLWNDPIENLSVEDISKTGSIRAVYPEEENFGRFDFFAKGDDYWLTKSRKVITWSGYKMVPKEESDLEKMPECSEGKLVLRNRYQETLAKLDRKAFEEGKAQKRVPNDIPLPDDAVKFRDVYGPWDDYKKTVRIPQCFL